MTSRTGTSAAFSFLAACSEMLCCVLIGRACMNIPRGSSGVNKEPELASSLDIGPDSVLKLDFNLKMG